MPFLAGYFLGRYVEAKKLNCPEPVSDKSRLHAFDPEFVSQLLHNSHTTR